MSTMDFTVRPATSAQWPALEDLFPGIAAAFARHGFEEVARRKPDRPVMRKLLGDVRDFST